MPRSIYLKEDIDVLVVSAGGVGTTFLMETISKYAKINSSENKDGLKHLPIPPIVKKDKIKAVYIFGDPLTATISLFRRKYHHAQSVISQYFYANPYIVPLERPLEEYAKKGRKGLFFERHFLAWKTSRTSYPILFLRYDAIHDQLNTLKEYLDLPDSFVDEFPVRRERAANPDQLDKEVLFCLEKMYGDWQRKQMRLPDIFEKTADPGFFPALSRPYLNAYWAEIGKKVPLIAKIGRRLKA